MRGWAQNGTQRVCAFTGLETAGAETGTPALAGGGGNGHAAGFSPVAAWIVSTNCAAVNGFGSTHLAPNFRAISR